MQLKIARYLVSDCRVTLCKLVEDRLTWRWRNWLTVIRLIDDKIYNIIIFSKWGMKVRILATSIQRNIWYLRNNNEDILKTYAHLSGQQTTFFLGKLTVRNQVVLEPCIKDKIESEILYWPISRYLISSSKTPLGFCIQSSKRITWIFSRPKTSTHSRRYK